VVAGVPDRAGAVLGVGDAVRAGPREGRHRAAPRDLVVDVFLATDITAFFDRSANVFVDDRRKIATRYLTRPWFAMDVASTVPFHIIYRLVSGSSTGFRYLNLLRLWRLRRVSKLFARYSVFFSAHASYYISWRTNLSMAVKIVIPSADFKIFDSRPFPLRFALQSYI
jgi:hypothetical protein